VQALTSVSSRKIYARVITWPNFSHTFSFS